MHGPGVDWPQTGYEGPDWAMIAGSSKLGNKPNGYGVEGGRMRLLLDSFCPAEERGSGMITYALPQRW